MSVIEGTVTLGGLPAEGVYVRAVDSQRNNVISGRHIGRSESLWQGINDNYLIRTQLRDVANEELIMDKYTLPNIEYDTSANIYQTDWNWGAPPVVLGNYAYVFINWTGVSPFTRRIRRYNISDLSYSGLERTEEYNSGESFGVPSYTNGTYLYVREQTTHKIFQYNVSDLTPTGNTLSFGYQPNDMVVHGDYLYVVGNGATGQYKIRVYNKDTMAFVTESASIGSSHITGIYIHGDYIYGTQGANIFKRNLSDLSHVWNVSAGISTLATRCIVADDNFVYVGTNSESQPLIRMCSVADCSVVDTNSLIYNRANKFYIIGDYVYVICRAYVYNATVYYVLTFCRGKVSESCKTDASGNYVFIPNHAWKRHTVFPLYKDGGDYYHSSLHQTLDTLAEVDVE